ncbi:MAG: HAD-IA family hydrolase [Ruminococcus sp.]|nr:HAD-IA family hydrolase [Ruminococcus sp.]
MKYKILVFDLDGTLVDSIADLAIAVNRGLATAGLPTHDIAEYKRFVGNGREVLIDRAMGERCKDKNLRDTVSDVFNDYYARHCNDNSRAYDGCAELLRALSEMGVKTAVLSNKPDEFVAQILKKVYPEHQFDIAWGKRSDLPCKPDKTALLTMLSELGLSPSDCLYIGDSDVDVFTAKNAGVDMLGVEWGFRGRYELINAGADDVVSTAAQILEYIL